MKRVQFLKTEEDFKTLKIGDNILLKYKDGKIFMLKITKIEENQLIVKEDVSFLQETYINISSVINNGLNKYLEYIIVERNIKSPYSTQLDGLIKSMKELRVRLMKAYYSKQFCDNKTILLDLKAMSKGIATMMNDKLLYNILKGAK
jgi:hypothetical protein